MIYKLGQIFYQILADESDGTVEVWEWHVVTIRGRYVYAVTKLKGITWGKVSKKHGDFGWLRPFPAWCRKAWHKEQTETYFRITPESRGLYFSKVKALRKELSDQTLENFDSPELYEKAIRTLKSMLTREKNK
jgi:hypothetical protein